jgi:hypothetical protein
MRWFRANRTSGGRLALFALAVQLVLSFGHIHREDIFGPAAAPAGAVVVASAADPSAPTPADPAPGHADDYCAICASLYLLGTSFVPDVPQLPLPHVSYAIEHVDRTVVVLVVPQRAPFQSRAPPLA